MNILTVLQTKRVTQILLIMDIMFTKRLSTCKTDYIQKNEMLSVTHFNSIWKWKSLKINSASWGNSF